MATFTVTITDRASLVGIAKARANYNAGLPTTTDAKGVVTPNPGVLATDSDYIQMVMAQAAVSYAVQFGADTTKIDAQIATLQAQKAAVAAVS